MNKGPESEKRTKRFLERIYEVSVRGFRLRSRDPTSESLQPIQSARAEDDLRVACLPRAKAVARSVSTRFYVASPIPLPARECFRSSRP
jgi:hypothetical protein